MSSSRPRAVLLAAAAILAAVSGTMAHADSTTTDFESGFVAGSPNGQNGWTRLGTYDHEIVNNPSGTLPEFGNHSLRVSNAVGSNNYIEQTFSAPLADQAGAPDATVESSANAHGVTQNHFASSFTFGSTVPTAQQPGLVVALRYGDGDGSSMSNLYLTDQPAGLELDLWSFQDRNGGKCPDTDQSATSDWTVTPLGTALDRTRSHTLHLTIDFKTMPAEDVVTAAVDGGTTFSGTTLKDYAKICPHMGSVTGPTPVSTLGFHTGPSNPLYDSQAAPTTPGNGFLFDNISLSSGDLAYGGIAVSGHDTSAGNGTRVDAALDATSGDGYGVSYAVTDPAGHVFTLAGTPTAAHTSHLDVPAADLDKAGTYSVHVASGAASGIGTFHVALGQLQGSPNLTATPSSPSAGPVSLTLSPITDMYGNTGDGTATFDITAPDGTHSLVSAPVVNGRGVANLSGAQIGQAGTYSATASVGAYTSAPASFAITQCSADGSVAVSYPGPSSAGDPVNLSATGLNCGTSPATSGALAVEVRSPSGVTSDYSGALTTANPGVAQASIPGSALQLAGGYWVTTTWGQISRSGWLGVSPLNANHLQAAVSHAHILPAGSETVTITARDRFGNLTTNLRALSWLLTGPGAVPFSGTATLSQGVAHVVLAGAQTALPGSYTFEADSTVSGVSAGFANFSVLG